MKKVGGHRTHASSDRLRRLGFASGDTAAGRGCNALGRTLKRRGSIARQDKGSENPERNMKVMIRNSSAATIRFMV